MIRTEPLSENNPNNAIEFEDYLPKHEKITFLHGENEKTIQISLVKKSPEEKVSGNKKVEEESSEEECDVIFKVKLEKPEPTEVKISKKNVCLVTIVKGNEEGMLGDESKKLLEFYLSQQEATWAGQFKNAVLLGPQIDEDNLILEEVSLGEAISHFISIGWKILFSCIPPANIWGGKAAFWVSLFFIGICTMIVGEFAELLGCEMGIDDSITAVSLVALGTSLPDTFASIAAAKSSQYADSAIGNITGSNSVNVFLGLGLPWVIACLYWDANLKKPYRVPAGEVAYSVYVFLLVALVCFVILISRRIVSYLFKHNSIYSSLEASLVVQLSART